LCGEALWAYLAAPPYGLRISTELKRVLELMGYDTAESFKKLKEEDGIKKVQDFIRTTLLKF